MRFLFLSLLLLSQWVYASSSSEQLYIHFDRTRFQAGDLVRFKAYVLSEGLPSTRSTHFYLQVFNEKGMAVSVGHFPVLGATVDGAFSLPDTLSNGNYYVQAFTPLMLSATSNLYVKNIWVDATGFRSEKRTPGALHQIRFSPEGGTLHADQLNLVVFRSVDAYGNPVAVKGSIQTLEGQNIAPFQSLIPGLGIVRFRARSGVQYRAVVDSSALGFSLPAVVAGSVQLQVESEKSGKKFQLSRNPKIKLPSDLFRLTATIRGQIVYDQEISFGTYPSLIGHLITDSLPSGILLFELFDGDGKVLAKRPCFIDRGEWKAPVSMQRSRLTTVSSSDSMRFELLLPDSVMSSLSLSVMNDDEPFPDESILSRLYVLNEWPLSPNEVSSFLDLTNWNNNLAEWLLLASADRSDSVRRIATPLSNTIPSFLSVRGTVFDARSQERMSGGDLTVLLETESGYSKQWTLTLGEKGDFAIDSVVYSGVGSFYGYYSDKKGKVRSVRVDAQVTGQEMIAPSLSLFSREVAGRLSYSPVRFDEGFASDPRVKELDTLDLERDASRSAERSVEEKYTTGVFREAGKVTIDNINNPVNDKSINVVDFIKNRIQQVEIQGGRFVNRKNISLASGQKWQIGLFVNEQPADMGYLRTIRAMDVALIKFYEAGFVGSGSNYPGGALAIYLKDQSDGGNGRQETPFYRGQGFTAFELEGKPGYGDKERMLYWDPTIVIDRPHVPIKFKLPGRISQFRVAVSGFDSKGRLVFIHQSFSK
ncbi:MAG: hypothetical protein ACKO6Q_04600 [Bacteroidota bacterium]